MRLAENRNPLTLPEGKLRLVKNDVVVPVNISGEYVLAAVEVIKQKQDRTEFTTQAEIIEAAIEKYRWGFRQVGYHLAPKAPVDK